MYPTHMKTCSLLICLTYLGLIRSCSSQITNVPIGYQQTVTSPAYAINSSQSDTTVLQQVNDTTFPATITEDIEETGQNDKIPIYMGGFFSHGGVWDCSGVLPAVEMALDHINARSDILPDYDLRMVWNDTQCEASLGTRVLFDQLFRKPQKLILIGDGCSTSTQAIAGTAYNWNLNTMSYAASAPTLSNRVDYPYFYRTIMPDTMFNPARIRLMREFGWNRVGTIHGKHEIFSLTADHLLGKLKGANITVLTSETFASEDPTHQIQNFKTVDAKIITMNMYATKARRVLCEAYRNDMIGPGYVWMLVGWYAQKWWEEEDDTVSCSKAEMRKAAESSYYISTESLQLSTSPELTVANITAAQYVDMLKQYMKDPKWANYVWHNDNPFGYDAAWAIALMLHKAVAVLETHDRRLEDFTYDDKEMARTFYELLNETQFVGVSGPVSFRDGNRVGIIQIRQLQAGCPDSTWQLHNEECYQFVNQPLSYLNATQYCQTIESEIATINTETEYEFLLQTIHSNNSWKESDRWFIGLKSNGQDYEWEDSRFNDVDWTPVGSELASARDRKCVYMTPNQQDGWRTAGCETQLPFICRARGEFLERPVAMFTDNGEEGGFFERTGRFVWPGGEIPSDHTPEVVITVKRVHQGISIALYAAMCVLASLGIILAMFFLAFNLKYRKQRFVKMSSPNLNNVIILGSIFVYVGVFFGGLDSNLVSTEVETISCQLRVWFLSLGFVLAFGSMFSKTWRVHKVAAFKTPQRMIITDKQLLLMVLVLLFVDVIVLAVWHIVDPLTVQTREFFDRDDPDVPNQRLIPFSEYCSCKYHLYWLVSLYSYKALLLIFGTFLAWETRKVILSALNDSKLIGISVYNVIVLSIIGVSVSFVISDDPATLYIFTSCVVIFCTTITLLIVFVPKIISVYKYPDGPPNLKTSITHRTATVFPTQLEALAEENKKMKERLAVVEAENKRLKGGVSFESSVGERVSDQLKRGGMWCAGAICGCGSVSPEERYSPSQNGIDNTALEVSGVGIRYLGTIAINDSKLI